MLRGRCNFCRIVREPVRKFFERTNRMDFFTNPSLLMERNSYLKMSVLVEEGGGATGGKGFNFNFPKTVFCTVVTESRIFSVFSWH